MQLKIYNNNESHKEQIKNMYKLKYKAHIQKTKYLHIFLPTTIMAPVALLVFRNTQSEVTHALDLIVPGLIPDKTNLGNVLFYIGSCLSRNHHSVNLFSLVVIVQGISPLNKCFG